MVTLYYIFAEIWSRSQSHFLKVDSIPRADSRNVRDESVVVVTEGYSVNAYYI